MPQWSLTPLATAEAAEPRRRRCGVAEFDATASITVCAMTTDPTEAPLFRLAIEPDGFDGLREPSRLMVDKLNNVPRSKIGEQVGRLSDDDMLRLNRAIVVFLGLAGG